MRGDGLAAQWDGVLGPIRQLHPSATEPRHGRLPRASDQQANGLETPMPTACGVTGITDPSPDLPYSLHISGVRHAATQDSRDCL